LRQLAISSLISWYLREVPHYRGALKHSKGDHKPLAGKPPGTLGLRPVSYTGCERPRAYFVECDRAKHLTKGKGAPSFFSLYTIHVTGRAVRPDSNLSDPGLLVGTVGSSPSRVGAPECRKTVELWFRSPQSSVVHRAASTIRSYVQWAESDRVAIADARNAERSESRMHVHQSVSGSRTDGHTQNNPLIDLSTGWNQTTDATRLPDFPLWWAAWQRQADGYETAPAVH
jgi:hypothetical protein